LLEERQLLSHFDGFNSSRFIGPSLIEQAAPLVLRVVYAPSLNDGDTGMIIPRGNWSPGPQMYSSAYGGGPFNSGRGMDPHGPGPGMMPPGPVQYPTTVLIMHALGDWGHGPISTDSSLSETLNAGPQPRPQPGMIHADSYGPGGPMFQGMASGENLAAFVAHNDGPADSAPRDPASSPEEHVGFPGMGPGKSVATPGSDFQNQFPGPNNIEPRISSTFFALGPS